MHKFILISLLCLFAVSAEAASNMPAGRAPMMEALFKDVPRGVFKGRLLLEEGKKILPDHPIAMVVFQGSQKLLMLDKTTDSKGLFEFKNIFKDASFSYALGVMHEGRIYLFTQPGLNKDEDVRTFDFEIGPKSPYLIPEELMNIEATNEGMPLTNAAVDYTVSEAWGRQYQMVTWTLGGLVLLLALYFGWKPYKPQE